MPRKATTELTHKQQQVLSFLQHYITEHGYPPSLREVGEHMGVSSMSALAHIRALEKKGFVRRAGLKPRTMDPFPGARSKSAFLRVPLIGRVAAGKPLLASENVEDYILIASEWASGETVFALRVKGDSMIEEHILDGDLVVVKKQPHAQPGDIVVALLEDEKTGDYEATVKKYEEKDGQIILKPCHPTMPAIRLSKKDRRVEIAGKVVGVIRKLS